MPVKSSTSKGRICLCNSSNDPERSQCACLCVCFCLCVHNGPLVETGHLSPSGEATYGIKQAIHGDFSNCTTRRKKDQSPFPPFTTTHTDIHTLKAESWFDGEMEISASVPMNAIISFHYSECSGDLWEGVGAISSLCWINAVILYQESLGITLNRAGFMQNGFKPSFFLNDGPNLLAHFKLLISFIFK